jgi:hypothetical protein
VSAAPPSPPEVAPGDVIAVRHRHQGQTDVCDRSALVLELPHRGPWPCRVRWEDNGLEELLYPRADIVIEQRSRVERPAVRADRGRPNHDPTARP